MIMRRAKEELTGCCCILCALTLAIVLVAAYAFVVPVVVTVDKAALGRLALAVAPAVNGNGKASSLAFNLTLAVAVRNSNWAMSAWLTAPPVGELRFRGVPFARGWLAGAAGAGREDRIRARRTEVYRVSAADEGVAVALGSDAVAEFKRESAAGVFELELVVVGEVRYQARFRGRRFRASCPLKLSTAEAAFARVSCT